MRIRPLSKRLRIWLIGVAAVFLAPALLGVGLYTIIEFDPKKLEYPDNVVFQDRRGDVLRFLPDEKGERHIWVPLEEIPEVLQKAFIAAEDERFYSHPGFDPVAISRALYSNMREQRIVSGASTLTQQVVRSVYPRKRTYAAKLTEAVRALKAERCFSKDEILEQYLNRAPLGNNLVGVRLGAKVYFGKSLDGLSLSECALLAALPKAPGTMNPYYSDRSRLLERRNWVLRRMEELGYITKELSSQGVKEPIRVIPKDFPMEAPHFVDLLLARGVTGDRARETIGAGALRTPLDLDLQHRLEKVVLSHRERLKSRGAPQAAAMIVDNRTMEVLALVGSIQYGRRDGGYNNGCTALRSPGSTLKPFLYGLAMERGYTPASLLEDTERRYRSPKGDYIPRNYDHREYGPVNIRSALGNSLNLSAIRMIDELGYRPFYDWLDRAGLINDPSKGPDFYGLGLAIGNPEVTLEQLVANYAMLANGGVYRPLRYLRSDSLSETQRLLSPQAAWLITDILSDPAAKSLTFASVAHLDFPYRVAWKTGTSNGYRDSWIVGYTPEYTVGVWAGNFRGDATYNLSGSEGAGGIFADIIKSLYRQSNPGVFEQPEGVVGVKVCSHSGMKPSPHCRHIVREWSIKGTEPHETCTFHVDEAERVRIPTRYAGWIHDLERKGIDSPYAVALAIQDPDSDLEGAMVSNAPPAGPVRIGSNAFERAFPRNALKENIQIMYPLDRDRFVMEGRGVDRRIALKAESAQPEASLTWFMDGVEFAQTGPPYQTAWRLERGVHTLSVSGSKGMGDSVQIVVE
ncbi:MAG: penicillin-binding protein 1C [Candidatus Omnitrophica bacterium]|nr:penicillin-binding protein 1C [Candidatus Omnitrophota bacterium]